MSLFISFPFLFFFLAAGDGEQGRRRHDERSDARVPRAGPAGPAGAGGRKGLQGQPERGPRPALVHGRRPQGRLEAAASGWLINTLF